MKSALVAVLTAVAGMIGAAVLASFLVAWYNISSFEGGAGFFVVGIALVGLIGGLVIGLVTSLALRSRSKARFGQTLGTADVPRTPYFYLGAMSGETVRKIEHGPVFIDDVRQEDGRWIVPGALPIFTTRGRRFVNLGAGDDSIAAFIVPLPGRPHRVGLALAYHVERDGVSPANRR